MICRCGYVCVMSNVFSMTRVCVCGGEGGEFCDVYWKYSLVTCGALCIYLGSSLASVCRNFFVLWDYQC